MKCLAAEVHAKIDAAYPDVELEAPKVFRIHRNLRFSKDKTPYKTHVGAILSTQAQGAVTEVPAALYMHFGTEIILAGDMYMMSPAALLRFRAAVADDKSGSALAAILRRGNRAGLHTRSSATLAKVPRGFAADHPRADLLQLKGLMFAADAPTPALLTSPKLVGYLVNSSLSNSRRRIFERNWFDR